MPTADEARQHVIAERERRGWMSARRAAEQSPVTNTTWSKYEAGGKLTASMRHAVSEAYGWPINWPEELPELSPLPSEREDEIVLRLDRIELLVRSLVQAVEQNQMELLEGQNAGLEALLELRQRAALVDRRAPKRAAQ